MSKFKVTVENAAKYYDGEGDESFVLVVTNRHNRAWFYNYAEGCPGNAAESAMVLQEMLDNGEKLNKENWTEYEDAQLEAAIKEQKMEGIIRESGLS
jgi:hypothetical protein